MKISREESEMADALADIWIEEERIKSHEQTDTES